MRRVLAAAVLVAFMPTANAQDKGKADFSSNAEFRARYFLMQNPGGNEDTLSRKGEGYGRFKIDVNYKANEKVSAHATLIHSATFGQDDDAADFHDTQTDDPQDLLSVNQAFGKWMASDDLTFQVGRMNYQVADGALIGINDWETMPYAFEGLLASWEQEWGRLQFVAFKPREIDSSGTHPTAGSSASGDPEHNMYGLNFDLKSKPEWLKMFNAHIFKNNSDAEVAATVGNGKVMGTDLDGLDVIRYGAMAGLSFADFEVNLWYETQGGEIKHIDDTPAGTKTSYDYKGSMMQAEVAYNLASFMDSRFHFMYHTDSGDDNTGDTEFGTYDSYFTQKHNSAGAMDLFGWGNLTFMQLGWKFKAQEKTTVGLQYTMFSMTEASATSAGFTSGTFGGDLPGAGSQNNLNDKLGDEIDLWATHNYDANLSTTLRLGYFMPGDRFEPVGGTASTDAITHIMLEGKATF